MDSIFDFYSDSCEDDGSQGDPMVGSITFYIHGANIEYGGQLFSAGELTADLLNLSPDVFENLQDIRSRMERQALAYEKTQDRSVWWRLNNLFMELHEELTRYRVFQTLLGENERLLSEARQYTEQRSLFSEKDDDGDLSIEQWARLTDLAETTGETPRQLLIFPGTRKEKWEYYRHHIERYDRYLDDVGVFNSTIHNFIKYILAPLKHNSAEEYAAALHFLYSDGRLAEKLIANPNGIDAAFYHRYDPCFISYVPRQTPDGKAAIFQQHITDSLQLLLKADYMTALNAGYQIRRCLVCKKYFLVKSGAHALYCEGACPHAPQFTCRQFGNYKIQRELTGDIPKLRVKSAAFERIQQDRKRGIITAEEERILKDEVRNRVYAALNDPTMTGDRLDRLLASKNLYADCGVIRKARPRGRPRKVKDGEAP